MTDTSPAVSSESWLQTYYYLRAGVAIAWVAAAFTIGKTQPIAGALLIIYPAWDALANVLDAQRNGGLAKAPSQALNALVSALTAIAMAFAVARDMHAVAAVFGGWAIVAGLLQLATALRRRKAGAQWTMILSGLQSALAGGFFASLALKTAEPALADLAPYAAFGALWFFVAAILLTLRRR
jgi:uncharacterized membrane protein HdeD (DUF308 family)